MCFKNMTGFSLCIYKTGKKKIECVGFERHEIKQVFFKKYNSAFFL